MHRAALGITAGGRAFGVQIFLKSGPTSTDAPVQLLLSMSLIPQRPAQTSSCAPDASLAEGRRRFIELWGHMAGNWGVPRSMAEIHALLFIEGRPMNSDAIMERLGISRGNASMSLRTLEEWGIVSRTHCKTDRRDYFSAEQNVQTLFATVLCARKRREIDPLLAQLIECRRITATEAAAPDEQKSSAPELNAHNRKLDDMVEFVRAFDALTTRFLGGNGCGLAEAMQALRAAP